MGWNGWSGLVYDILIKFEALDESHILLWLLLTVLDLSHNVLLKNLNDMLAYRAADDLLDRPESADGHASIQVRAALLHKKHDVVQEFLPIALVGHGLLECFV